VAVALFLAGNFSVFAGTEPIIRIGLSTNASSASITTSDISLVAYSPGLPDRLLATSRITVSARAYRPPEVEVFRVEFQNLPTQDDANLLARDIRQATGENCTVSFDAASSMWRVVVGALRESEIDAEEFKAKLAEKGFEDSVIIGERRLRPSDDAVDLSQQVRSGGKGEVRSLIRPTASTAGAGPAPIDPNLREVVINGPSEMAKYSSLRAVSFGSINERANPVRYNGKAYRGRIEVFVNARGLLTVVNVVPLEEYLLGVVPAELGLPQLEAQKAQAVAARTYAIANIGTYGRQGFDMVPTVWSQVYKGVSIETRMGTQAVRETRGIIATHGGKPIMAYYTSTCGGRTENSENVFDHAEPYLRGVECSLEGRRHFEPFLIKSNRPQPRVRDDASLELVRRMSLLAANGFYLSGETMTDDWFADIPSEQELNLWLGQLAIRFGKPAPQVSSQAANPIELARIIASFAYAPGVADTMLTESDINYLLGFADASEIPRERRAEIAMLMRDGLFSINADQTFQPGRPFTRARLIRLIGQIYDRRKWTPEMLSGVTRPSVDGKLVIRTGRTDRQLNVRPDVFLFRDFGGTMYPVREAALVGGENVRYQLDSLGAVKYLEIEPTSTPTTAENMSPWVNWSRSGSAAEIQSRLSRYVRGIGTLYDLNVKQVGYSRRAVELEIIGSNGVKTLKGGKIRSALRLPEQLFVMNKRYAGDRVASYTFTGRGWGHGVGMCQYGAFGLAKMGVKYDEIIRHYYTGVELREIY
jgi:stage II sporulation protein D